MTQSVQACHCTKSFLWGPDYLWGPDFKIGQDSVITLVPVYLNKQELVTDNAAAVPYQCNVVWFPTSVHINLETGFKESVSDFFESTHNKEGIMLVNFKLINKIHI